MLDIVFGKLTISQTRVSVSDNCEDTKDAELQKAFEQ